MRYRYATRIMALAAVLTAYCGYAFGQPCEPEWDVTVGTPGVSHPYLTWSIDALHVHDDGSGEMLYAAGSFGDFAGLPGTSLIASWDRASNTWSGLDGGLDDSGFVSVMASFDAGSGFELIVGGVFPGTVSGVPYTSQIAKWNGSEWSALGTGIGPDLVGAMTTWDGVGGNRLYVGGRFPTAGGATANGIAAWDGAQWHSMGDGITGWQAYVASMMVWDDGSGEKLYVGGRFDTMDGLNTPLIARWDGQVWEQVGSGLINDMFMFGIESMEVYDDGSGPALYVGGHEFHAPGQPVGDVSKWDGVQWTTVGTLRSGRCTSLCVFDDGSGPGLYRTGNAYPDLGYFAQLVNGDWEMVGGGITRSPYSNPWPSTSDLVVWDDWLYVCGFFNRAGGYQGVGGLPCGDIAAWGGCPGSPTSVESPGQDGTPALVKLLGCYPNPFNPSTVITFSLAQAQPVSLNIQDAAGRRVNRLGGGEVFPAGVHELAWDGWDESGNRVSSGVYFYTLHSGDYRETRRMVLVK